MIHDLTVSGHLRGYYFEEDRQVLVIPTYSHEDDDGTYTCNVVVASFIDTRQINVTGYGMFLRKH